MNINRKLTSLRLEVLNLIHSGAASYQLDKLVSITIKNQLTRAQRDFFLS